MKLFLCEKPAQGRDILKENHASAARCGLV